MAEPEGHCCRQGVALFLLLVLNSSPPLKAHQVHWDVNFNLFGRFLFVEETKLSLLV